MKTKVCDKRATKRAIMVQPTYDVTIEIQMKASKKHPYAAQAALYLGTMATLFDAMSLRLDSCGLENPDGTITMCFMYKECDPNNIVRYLGHIDNAIQKSEGKKVKKLDNCTIMHEEDFAKKYKMAMRVDVFDIDSVKHQVNYFAPNGKFEVNSKLKTLDGFLKKVK